jgi:hypothetical protein
MDKVYEKRHKKQHGKRQGYHIPTHALSFALRDENPAHPKWEKWDEPHQADD